MSIKKFIESVISSLNLEGFESKGKKKSVKRLLEKLETRKVILANTKRKSLSKEEKKALKEELAIISLQIKKGNQILDELNAQNSKNKQNKKEN